MAKYWDKLEQGGSMPPVYRLKAEHAPEGVYAKVFMANGRWHWRIGGKTNGTLKGYSLDNRRLGGHGKRGYSRPGAAKERAKHHARWFPSYVGDWKEQEAQK